jgi:class 3 adenylate cyclase
MINSFLVLIWTCILISQKSLATTGSVEVDQTFSQRDLTGKILFFQDNNDDTNIDDVYSKRNSDFFADQSQIIALKEYGDSIVWSKFSIYLAQSSNMKLIIEHDYASSYFDLYHFYENGQSIYSNGMGKLNKLNPYVHRVPYEEVLLRPGLNEFYTRMKTPLLNTSIKIYSTREFLSHATYENMKICVFFGGVLVVIIYNLGTYFAYKNKENRNYLLYLIFMALFISWVQGVGGIVFGEYTIDFIVQPGLAYITLAIFFMGQFTLSFFDVEEKLGKQFHNFCVIFNYIALSGSFVLLFYNSFYITVPLVLSQIAIIVVQAILLVRKRYRPAILYLLSFFPMGLGFAFLGITSLDYNDYWHIGNDLVLGGILVETALLSMAIGDKYAQTLKNKNLEIMISKKSRDHAYEQLSKMVYPHQIRKIEQNIPLEETMPRSHGEACVISFDVIESSKIEHIKVKEFFRNVFRRCNEIMIENYDPETLTSNAFRIKEMGDGFLCAVGYPFKSPTDNPANDAIVLAYRFKNILSEEAKILERDDPVCCGIGIALDTLQGFYPEGGTKEYDIYGRALVLATRYEGLRKAILRGQKPRSIMICQKRVITSASKRLRGDFREIRLDEAGIVVRDDPAATLAYVQYLDNEAGFQYDDKSTLEIVS